MLPISYQILGYIVNTPWLISKCSLSIWILEVPHIFMFWFPQMFVNLLC